VIAQSLLLAGLSTPPLPLPLREGVSGVRFMKGASLPSGEGSRVGCFRAQARRGAVIERDASNVEGIAITPPLPLPLGEGVSGVRFMKGASVKCPPANNILSSTHGVTSC